MANQEKRKSRFFLGLVVGFMMGALGLAVAPQWWRNYVPDTLLPGGAVDGVVVEKSTESARLLLKLETSDGVLLATFTERLEEINLLVESGDEVTLRVPRYEPFITDPRLERVRKAPPRDVESEPPGVIPEPPFPSPVEEPLEEETPTESPTKPKAPPSP